MQANSNKIEGGQAIPNFAVRFANILLILGAVFWFCEVVYVIYRIYVPFKEVNIGDEYYQKTYFKYALVGIFICISFFLALKLRNNLKVNISLVIFALAVSIFSVETFLEFNYVSDKDRAEKMGIPFDSRSYNEALKDFKDKYDDFYVNWLPSNYTAFNGIEGDSERIYPFGGVSNITTNLPNEGGYYPIIKLDEYGFHNPRGLYREGEIDIILIGDSYTEGVAVNSDENIAAGLRKAGFNVINFGKSANGPLIQYGALKEYAKTFKPKIVVWLFFINDLIDLSREASTPILKRYLDEDNFSQNLLARQEEIDRSIVKLKGWEWTDDENKFRNIAHYPISHIIKLYNLRKLWRAAFNSLPKNYSNPTYEKILKKGKDLVESWGGKLYCVYLPFMNEVEGRTTYEIHKYFLRAVSGLDAPVIDTYEAFASHSDPMSFTPLRRGHHYNGAGYQIVAEFIAKRLKEDGIVPISVGKNVTNNTSATMQK